MAFCDLDGDLEVMEAMVKHIIRRVMERCPDDLAFFNSFVDKAFLSVSSTSRVPTLAA